MLNNIIHLKHNANQNITSDTVLSRIGDLENNNLKSLLLAVYGKSETAVYKGLTIEIVSAMVVKVKAGIFSQYVDDFESLLAIESADSSNITLTAAASSTRIDIIQAKIERIDTNSQTVQTWDGASVVPTVANIDKKTQITYAKKDGTAGTGLPATPDSGYVKIAEITVPANSTYIINDNIRDVYAQSSWIISQPVVINKTLNSLRVDLDQLRADFEAYKASLASFSVSGNTTVNSIKHEKAVNPAGDSGSDFNPFSIDLDTDGRIRYGIENLILRSLYLDNYGYYRTEDERVRMKGGFIQDSDGFYWCERAGDKVYITFKGTACLMHVKSGALYTNNLQVKVDTGAPTSIDLNYGIDIGDSCVIKLADNLTDTIHTIQIYLSEHLKFAFKGFTILSPVTGLTVNINKGKHYILDTLVDFSAFQTQLLTAYTDNGRRDLFLVNQDGTLSFVNGNTLGINPLYAGNSDHSLEESYTRFKIIDFWNQISKIDNYSGIFVTSEFIRGDIEANYVISQATVSGTRIEIRINGTGCDVDLMTSTSNTVNVFVDGNSVGTFTPVAGKRQLYKLCSGLEYGSHKIELTFTTGIAVSLWQAVVYRPATPVFKYDDKVAIGALNRVKSGVFKYELIEKLGLLNGADWTKQSDDLYVAGDCIQSANSGSGQTLIIPFIGSRIKIYGNKGGLLGKFNITLDSNNFSAIDTYSASPVYDTVLWDSSVNGGLTLTYGVHLLTLTTTATGQFGNTLQFTGLSIEQLDGWIDYENNPMKSPSEIARANGIQQNFDILNRVIEEQYEWNQKEHNSIYYELDARITSIQNLYSFRRQITYNQKYGFWGEVAWKSSTQIVIKKKTLSGQSWIGFVLNTGEYIENTTSDITLDISTLANRADSIASVLANEWYALYCYKDSGGNLAFKFGWMPQTTLSASNPTNILSLNTVSSTDISKLFPVGSEICLFESTSKLETPIFYSGGSYDPLRGKPIIASYPAGNQVQLGASLSIANFTLTTTKVYQVNGFQPLTYSTGALHSDITELRGWGDTGIRIRTDGSSNILIFNILDGKFNFVPQTTMTTKGFATYYYGFFIANYSSGSFGNFFSNYMPPDKKIILACDSWASGVIVTNPELVVAPYYNNGFGGGYDVIGKFTNFGSNLETSSGLQVFTGKYDLHKILYINFSGSAFNWDLYIKGYVI